VLVVTGFVVVLSLTLSRGVYTPPVVLDGGRPAFTLTEFPEGTERISLAVAPGIALEGVFVPARVPDAPVALILLESQASITQGARPYGRVGLGYLPEPDELVTLARPEDWPEGLPPESGLRAGHMQLTLLARLRNLGLSSLVVDYEGVGASGGVRTPEVLRRDARSAWDEALARAGGDPSKVVVRGTSLGTLAAATLLQDGIRPAAVILIAPVRAETLAINFFAEQRGAWLAGLASWFVADAADVDLLETVEDCSVPLLVIAPQHDFLLPADETERLRAAAVGAGGHFAVRKSDHYVLTLAARGGLNAEMRFLETVLGDRLPDRRAALSVPSAGDVPGPQARGLSPGQVEIVLAATTMREPRLAAAVLRARVPPGDYFDIEEWTSWLPERRWQALDDGALAHLLDLGREPTRIDPGSLRESVYLAAVLADSTFDEVLEFVESTVRHGKVQEAGFSVTHATGLLTVTNPRGALANALLIQRDLAAERPGLAEGDAERHALRFLLKALGFADRVVTRPDGRAVLQAWVDDAWHFVEWPASASPTAGATGSSAAAAAASTEPIR
jgi:alpha/beta superfamily hydrolase